MIVCVVEDFFDMFLLFFTKLHRDGTVRAYKYLQNLGSTFVPYSDSEIVDIPLLCNFKI